MSCLGQRIKKLSGKCVVSVRCENNPVYLDETGVGFCRECFEEMIEIIPKLKQQFPLRPELKLIKFDQPKHNLR